MKDITQAAQSKRNKIDLGLLDLIICINNEMELQENLTIWEHELKEGNMKINTNKTKVMSINKEKKYMERSGEDKTKGK